MSGHAEGRLTFRANGDANSYALIGDDGRWWMLVLMNSERTTERQESNLRRLAACWNACDGIDTDLIEPRMLGDQIAAKMAVINKCDRLNTENAALNEHCATVEKHRDRLLASARVTVEAFDSLPPTSETRMVPLCINGLRDAIASAEAQS